MNDQAKLLLNAYRPGGADATDPAFTEALAQARHDPQLRAWFEESQQFDQAIAERLRTVVVPANLRGTILAGARFSAPRRWWSGSRIWAVAAAFAVIVSLLALWPPPGSGLDSWQADSLAVLGKLETGGVKLDIENPKPASLVDWLRDRSAPVPDALPPSLTASASFGCKMIDSNGRKVSLICFDLGNGEAAHLFTTPSAGLKIQPPEKHPIFSRHENWNLARWRAGDDVHMLATEIDETRLRALLPATIAALGMPPALLGELFPNH